MSEWNVAVLFFEGDSVKVNFIITKSFFQLRLFHVKYYGVSSDFRDSIIRTLMPNLGKICVTVNFQMMFLVRRFLPDQNRSFFQ